MADGGCGRYRNRDGDVWVLARRRLLGESRRCAGPRKLLRLVERIRHQPGDGQRVSRRPRAANPRVKRSARRSRPRVTTSASSCTGTTSTASTANRQTRSASIRSPRDSSPTSRAPAGSPTSRAWVIRRSVCGPARDRRRDQGLDLPDRGRRKLRAGPDLGRNAAGQDLGLTSAGQTPVRRWQNSR